MKNLGDFLKKAEENEIQAKDLIEKIE